MKLLTKEVVKAMGLPWHLYKSVVESIPCDSLDLGGTIKSRIGPDNTTRNKMIQDGWDIEYVQSTGILSNLRKRLKFQINEKGDLKKISRKRNST